MRYAVLVGLLAVLVATIASWPDQPRSVGKLIEGKRVGLGQSITEVRAALGEPVQITKTDTYWKTTENWVYREGERTFLLTFEAGKLLQIAERLTGVRQ